MTYAVLCNSVMGLSVGSHLREASHGPLTRFVKLRVANATGMPGTFSPPPQVNDPDMHHGTCVSAVMHAGDIYIAHHAKHKCLYIRCNISATYFIIRNMRHSISYTFITNCITCFLGKPSCSCSLIYLTVIFISTLIAAQVHSKQCCKIQWVNWNLCTTYWHESKSMQY